MRGGPFFWLLARTRLTGPSVSAVLRGGLVLAVIAWVPLLLAAFSAGHAGRTGGGFLADIGVHARMVVAMPLLLVAERSIGRRFTVVVGYLGRAGLVNEGNRRAALDAFASVQRLRDSVWMEAVFVVLVLAASAVQGLFDRSGPPWLYAGPHLSAAGFWYFLVSVTLYRFLLLRWVFRITLWALLLARLVRAPLALAPCHPDRMGGLSVIADAHQSFGWLVFALGASLAGYLTTRVRVTGAPVTAYAYEVGVFVVLAPLLALAPLVVFCMPLQALRRSSHEAYGAMAADFGRRYRDRWLRPTSDPLPLESPEASTHTDLSTSFDRATEVRRIPFLRKDFLILFTCAAAPMILFLLQGIPLLEILESLRKILG